MPSVTDGAPSRRNSGFRLALIPISQSFLTNLIKFCLFAHVGRREAQPPDVRIIPAPWVSLVASSTRMKLPVARLRR
jgi:hypothetical protein